MFDDLHDEYDFGNYHNDDYNEEAYDDLDFDYGYDELDFDSYDDDYDYWNETFDDGYGRGHYLVCNLRVKNIPDDMDAYRLYEILKGRCLSQDIIDVKIQQREYQQIESAEEMEEQIKQENYFSSMIRSLEQDGKYNGGQYIGRLLTKLDQEGKCFKLKFDENDPRNFHKKLDQKSLSDQIKKSTFLRSGLDFIDCNNFITDLWKLSEHPIKEKYSQRKDSNQKIRYRRDKKKSAIVSILGYTRDLKSLYHDQKISDQETYVLYTSYLGGKKGVGLSKSLQYKKVQQKEKIECTNIEFGVFDPKNPDKFCRDLEISKINKNMFFYFLYSNQKPTDKIEILFEIPQLQKFAKVEFTYLQCEKVYCQENYFEVTLFFQLSSPPSYFISGYNENYYQCLHFCQNWERMPNFTINSQNDCLLLRTFKTQNSVIKVTFRRNKWNSETWKYLLTKVGVPFQTNPLISSSPQPVKNPYLNFPTLMYSKLSFESKYALLACLSQQKINLFNITEIFFKKLQLQDSLIVEKTLKDISQKISHIKNLEDFFTELYQENERSKKLWEKSINLESISRTKRVTVTPTLMIYYIEEPEQSNTILRRYKDQEKNFLRITFEDDNGGNVRNLKYITNKKFKDILKIFQIFNRSYKFLAYSSSQLKNNSAWMIYEQGECQVQKIHTEIGDLSHIKNPAKRAARLGQLFSTSLRALILNDSITITRIPDIKNQKYTFSDGVGKISTNLIDQIKLNQKIKGVVSAIQIRCGGVKGILVSDPTLPSSTICFRDSMIKFESSSFDKNLELLDYSKFRPGYLNRQIILLLLSNGVESQIFLELQNENIKDLEKRDQSILDYINNEHHLSPTRDLLNDCFDAKINIAQEPFVSAVLETIKIRSFINLKEKCNILVKNSARLTGVIDEYGILEYGQIYLCISPSNSKSKDCLIIKADKVLITKNPCLYPGDIRILEAVDHDRARKHFQHLVNVVVFPSKGSRPHPDEIAGSDLDGDMYFVSWDQRLIPPRISDPIQYEAKNREENSENVQVEDMINFFIEFLNNDMLGKIDNLHLARADSSNDLAHNYKCLVYSELHAIAVDYAKTGVPAIFTDYKSQLRGISDRESRRCGWGDPKEWPDFMEKDPELTYESETILGTLYRLIVSKIETSGIKYIFSRDTPLHSSIQIDCDMIEEGFEDFLEEVFVVLKAYYKAIHELFKIYEIRTEYEIFSGNFLEFMTNHKGGKKKYNLEKVQQKLIIHIEYMKQNLLKILLLDCLEEQDFKDEQGNFAPVLCQMVSAIYLLSYYNSPENCHDEHVNEVMITNRYAEKLNAIRSIYKNIQLIGLPWFFFKDVLLYIKIKNSSIHC